MGVNIPFLFTLQNSTQLTLPLSTWYSELQVATSVLRQVSAVPSAAMDWLYSIQSTLPLCERVPDALPLLVTHLILWSEGDLCRLALDTVAGITEADPAQVHPRHCHYYFLKNVAAYSM